MATVLKGDGLSYMEYVGQITYLLFLKMAHELTQAPYNRPPIIPAPWDWPNLLKRDGAELADHYNRTLDELGKRKGMLGAIFLNAKSAIKDPAKLRRLVVDLIEKQEGGWVTMDVDVKGAIYEELLNRTAAESPSGAGQYFTPRPLIRAIVDVVQPKPDDSICDPAAGTGGFLLIAHEYVVARHGAVMDHDDHVYAKERLISGMELVPDTGRLCVMNLYLHSIGGDESPILVGHDSLAQPAPQQYSIVLTNPPFGKKGSIITVDDEGELERERQVVSRPDFWQETTNKQLNFVQHVFTMLKIDGRAAVVVPDNVLFEGGTGEKIRRRLLETCDVHTLLRLPTGIFYKPGVKANVLFFDKKPGSDKAWTKKLWIYDLRTNVHYTLKQNPISRTDFDEFVESCKPGMRHARKANWSEANPGGRWRCFDYDDLVKRDKLNLDIFWLKDESLEDSENLPEPEVIAAEIADDLQTALEQFRAIQDELSP
jgi:type I restriction enzyme M protein